MDTRVVTELDAFNAGYDCVLNGANTTNCHFTLFGSRDLTAAWERGKVTADRIKLTDTNEAERAKARM